MKIKRLHIDNRLCLIDFDIEFTIESDGSSTILIGENGAGKSTMIECILNILMSFDSPAIEKQIDYSYSFDYEYAQKAISIIKKGRNYHITVDGNATDGNYKKVRAFTQKQSLFPQRVVAFYSGANNKILPHIRQINHQYKKFCRDTLNNFLKSINDDSERFLPNFPKRKYNYCEESFTPIYLLSILSGQDSFEKSYLIETCHFDKVQYVDVDINGDKVERILGRKHFEGNVLTGLYHLIDFIDYRFTNILRSGFMDSSAGKIYFQIKNIDSLGVDSITILEFFEKLYSLFDAKIEVIAAQGESDVKCSEMSEGQRQLIKILGMLGICKTEDCLVLMDEPDAHMNPKWKYEIEQTIAKSLRDAVNTQAIIATHDPLVINGVSKKFIRIFTRNSFVEDNKEFFFTRAVAPTEDTEGMGIDGLLQSEYYGLKTSYDKKATDKFLRRQQLYIKLINKEIDDKETEELRTLTKEIGSMQMSYNSIDFLYDDFIKVFQRTELYSKEYLTYEEILERRKKIEEIIAKLYKGKV